MTDVRFLMGLNSNALAQLVPTLCMHIPRHASIDRCDILILEWYSAAAQLLTSPCAALCPRPSH